MSNVLQFKKKQPNKLEEMYEERRTPLFIDHKNGRITGSPHFKRPQQDDMTVGERIAKIRDSFERINRLMDELKQLNTNERRI